MQLWVEQLILEYADKKRQLAAYRDRLDRDDIQQRHELRIVNGMITDLNYGMQWMRTGRCPTSRRGAESGDAYRYAELMDMDLLPLMYVEEEREEIIDPERKKLLVQILLRMSIRERQCYLLHTAKGLSYAEIAQQMNLSRASVQTFCKRAKTKVQQGIAW